MQAQRIMMMNITGSQVGNNMGKQNENNQWDTQISNVMNNNFFCRFVANILISKGLRSARASK